MNLIAKNERLVGLQVLRGIAALMVVYHHARKSIPDSEFMTGVGEAGVDIFFVISGFVMAWTTAWLPSDAARRERAAAARQFVANRVLRVVPLYWLALAWTAHRGFGTRFTATSLLQDLFFVPHPSQEYPGTVFPLVIQGWTLNYEMFFYALFAASLLFGRASRRILVGCILLLTGWGLSQAILHGIPPLDETQWRIDPAHAGRSIAAAFYTNSVMLEFCLGIALAGWHARGTVVHWPRWAFMTVLCLGLASFGVTHLQWPRGLMQGLPAALIVWASIPAFRGLQVRALQKLGDASYSIYLFHWASFAALKPLMARIAPDHHEPWMALALMAAHLAVAVATGLVVHALVEKPILKHMRPLLDRVRQPSAASTAA